MRTYEMIPKPYLHSHWLVAIIDSDQTLLNLPVIHIQGPT